MEDIRFYYDCWEIFWIMQLNLLSKCRKGEKVKYVYFSKYIMINDIFGIKIKEFKHIETNDGWSTDFYDGVKRKKMIHGWGIKSVKQDM